MKQEHRQTIRMVVGPYIRRIKSGVEEIVLLALGSAAVHYAVLPYLKSVGMVPETVILHHQSVFQTFATIVSLRIIAWLVAR